MPWGAVNATAWITSAHSAASFPLVHHSPANCEDVQGPGSYCQPKGIKHLEWQLKRDVQFGLYHHDSSANCWRVATPTQPCSFTQMPYMLFILKSWFWCSRTIWKAAPVCTDTNPSLPSPFLVSLICSGEGSNSILLINNPSSSSSCGVPCYSLPFSWSCLPCSPTAPDNPE